MVITNKIIKDILLLCGQIFFSDFSQFVMDFMEKVAKVSEEDQKWKNEFKREIKVEQDTSKIVFLYEDLVNRDLVKSIGSDFARKFKLRWFGPLGVLPKIFYINQSMSAAAVVEFRVDRSEDWQSSWLHSQRRKLLAKAALNL